MLILEFARRQKNLSQEQLSSASLVTAHFISLVENGRGIPTADQAERLARVLDVPAAALLQPVPDLTEVVARA